MGYGPADCYDIYGEGDFTSCDTNNDGGVTDAPSAVDDFVRR